MALLALPGGPGGGTTAAIEYAPPDRAATGSAAPGAFVLLLPGTSIRPGPGADKAAKYSFEPAVRGIYRSLALGLSEEAGLPCLQLCWRRFPADGGTTADAIQDIVAGLKFMQGKYGRRCGLLLVGYSFGGAAILAFLAQCGLSKLDADAAGPPAAGRSRLLGCVALSGALKGPGEDAVNLFGAMQYLEASHAPLLVVHGSADDNVSISAAQKLFKQVRAAGPALRRRNPLQPLAGGPRSLPGLRAHAAAPLGRWLCPFPRRHQGSSAPHRGGGGAAAPRRRRRRPRPSGRRTWRSAAPCTPGGSSGRGSGPRWSAGARSRPRTRSSW